MYSIQCAPGNKKIKKKKKIMKVAVDLSVWRIYHVANLAKYVTKSSDVWNGIFQYVSPKV